MSQAAACREVIIVTDFGATGPALNTTFQPYLQTRVRRHLILNLASLAPDLQLNDFIALKTETSSLSSVLLTKMVRTRARVR